jgi:ribosomal protein L23
MYRDIKEKEEREFYLSKDAEDEELFQRFCSAKTETERCEIMSNFLLEQNVDLLSLTKNGFNYRNVMKGLVGKFKENQKEEKMVLKEKVKEKYSLKMEDVKGMVVCDRESRRLQRQTRKRSMNQWYVMLCLRMMQRNVEYFDMHFPFSERYPPYNSVLWNYGCTEDFARSWQEKETERMESLFETFADCFDPHTNELVDREQLVERGHNFCNTCGYIKTIDRFRNEDYKKCILCKFNPKKPVQRFLRHLLEQSKSDSRCFENNLDMEHLKKLYRQQRGRCALTGVRMTFFVPFFGRLVRRQNNGKKVHLTFLENISLDRIVSTKGYLKGNVQLVTGYINRMKVDVPEPIFLRVCSLVYLNRERNGLEHPEEHLLTEKEKCGDVTFDNMI